MKELPPGWAWTTLGEACEITHGQSPPGSTYNTAGLGLPFFQGKADFGKLYPTARSWCSEPKKLAEAEDILISIRAPVGPTNIATERCCIGRGLAALRAGGAIQQRYLLYWLRLNEAELGRRASGSTFASITGNQLAIYPLLLAPIAEQRRIVAEIEKQLTRCEAGSGYLVQTGRKLQHLSDAKAEFEMRMDFRRRPMGEICEIKGGIQKQPQRRPASNAYPFLRVANVLRNALALNDIHFIELFPGELERLRLVKDDLLIVEGNGSPSEIGRMAIWDGSINSCVHQNHIIRARARGDVLPQFVAAYWNSPSGRRTIASISSSTSGLHTLSVSKVQSILVPVPPLSVQREAVGRIQRAGSFIDRAADDCRSLSIRAASLRQAILQKAFEGKLVSQNPNDEPASVLLERIRATRTQKPARRAVRKREVHA